MRLVMSTMDASTFDATSSVDSGLLPDVPLGVWGSGADDTCGSDAGRCEMPTGTPMAAPSAMPTIPAIRGVRRREGPLAGGSTGADGQGGDWSPAVGSWPLSTVASA